MKTNRNLWLPGQSIGIGIVCALALVLNPMRSIASPESPPQVHIEADRMEVQQKTRDVQFTGNVRIQRGQLELRCQSLRGTYAADGRMVSLNAEGPVTVKGPDFEARASKAVYIQKHGRLTLKGEPTLIRGKSSIKGQTITVWLDEERVVIESAKGTLDSSLLSPSATSSITAGW